MENINTVLAIDTAMAACSVAVVSEERYASLSEPMARGQSERIIHLVQEVMVDIDVDFSALDAIVCTVGPGAFTGLRAGVSAAKAFALSCDIPLYGITTLQALAYGLCNSEEFQGRLRVLVETRRDDFYVQDFDGCGRACTEPCAMRAEDIETDMKDVDIWAGDAVSRFLGAVGQSCDDFRVFEDAHFPDPLIMARCFLRGAEGYADKVEPLYLRGADVSKSKKEYRVLA